VLGRKQLTVPPLRVGYAIWTLLDAWNVWNRMFLLSVRPLRMVCAGTGVTIGEKKLFPFSDEFNHAIVHAVVLPTHYGNIYYCNPFTEEFQHLFGGCP
jgi:hypothetical protein